MINFFIAFFFSIVFTLKAEDNYNRSSFRFNSYSTDVNIGFYTGKYCKTNIDHVVSLKDAHDSGAKRWGQNLKELFANDKNNHVAACYKINSSKGSSIPIDFLRKSRDRKGLDYKIISFCKYLEIYFHIKVKYNLSLLNNDPILFKNCSINIKK